MSENEYESIEYRVSLIGYEEEDRPFNDKICGTFEDEETALWFERNYSFTKIDGASTTVVQVEKVGIYENGQNEEVIDILEEREVE